MKALSVKQKSSDISTTASSKSSSKTKKSLLSFASLLSGVKDTDLKTKNLKSSDETSKESGKTSSKNGLLTLLKDKSEESINPELISSMNPTEVKQLISQAKKYLKAQIYGSDALKKSEIASLPKSLKGLTQVAKKIGIDISKITLQTVKESTKDFKKVPSKNILQTEISTQEFVNVKTIKPEPQHKKKRVNSSLELLLSGEKASKNSNIISTEKGIAPNIKAVNTKNLESLLKTKKDAKEETKTEVMHTPKADSFEVKLHEAKQMVKYLSHDVKNAIDEYKSPFTRVKVQLNPQKLGEVDLTIVQRGKNLHINLSSNNAAINTLAMNVNDLKMQLNNSGINNATLNFSNNSQGGEFTNSGQQQQQQRENAQNEYNYFENEDKNEEILSSLEIVVPSYA